ncbi:hypothetical protein X752_09340 [Mesorhizobium sp. LNJC398B00]|nr:hypothetical protein X752_09340 [Mesorhizobium sp. LNJC398B00]
MLTTQTIGCHCVILFDPGFSNDAEMPISIS